MGGQEELLLDVRFHNSQRSVSLGLLFDRLGISDTEFHISFARSSGAGGQNVNKVNSKAVLRWNPIASDCPRRDVIQRFVTKHASRLTKDGDIIINSEEYRDQPRNLAAGFKKLEDMLAEVLEPPKKRRNTKPTRASKERRIDGKKKRGAEKAGRKKIQDY